MTTAPAVTTTPAVTATPVVTSAPATTAPATTAPATATVEPTNAPEETASAAPTASVQPTAIVSAAPATATPVASGPVITATATSITGDISFSKTNKTVGETIKVKFALKNVANVADYNYTYSVVKDSKEKVLAKNTTKTSVNWTLASKGTYQVIVNIYDANNTFVGTASTTYTAKARVITVKSLKAVKKGKNVKITAKAKVKSGKLKYKFVVKNKKNKTVATRKYAKKNNMTVKLSKKGTYKVYLYVTNGKATVLKAKSFKVK